MAGKNCEKTILGWNYFSIHFGLMLFDEFNRKEKQTKENILLFAIFGVFTFWPLTCKM